MPSLLQTLRPAFLELPEDVRRPLPARRFDLNGRREASLVREGLYLHGPPDESWVPLDELLSHVRRLDFLEVLGRLIDRLARGFR